MQKFKKAALRAMISTSSLCLAWLIVLATLTVGVASAASRNSIQEKNGELLRDGKPVFIIGIVGCDPMKVGIEKIREFGINAVQMDCPQSNIYKDSPNGESNWDIDLNRNPVPFYINTLNWAGKNGLMVLPQFQIRYWPRWFARQIKNSPATICGDGKPGFWWTLEGSPHTASVYDRKIKAFLTRNYKDYFKAIDPLLDVEVIAYISTNEPGYGSHTSPADYSPLAKKAFRKYLATKYKDIRTFNKKFGTKVSSFWKVKPPKTKDENRVLWYIWLNWNQHQWADFFSWVSKAIKAANPDAKVIHKHPVFELSPAHASIANLPELLHPSQDIYGMDCYAFSLNGYRNKIEIASSLADRRPVLNLETSPQWWLDGKRPAYGVGLAYMAQIIGGVKGIFHFQFDGTNPHPEHDLLSPKVFDSAARGRIRKLFKLIAANQDVFAAPKKKARIACYVSEASQIHDFLDGKYPPMVWGAYNLLRNQGYEVDFICDQQLLNGRLKDYKLLVIPSGSIVPSDCAAKMEEFYRKNGRFIVFGHAFEKNEFYGSSELPKFLGIKSRYSDTKNPFLEAAIYDVKPKLQPYFDTEFTVFGPESINMMPEAPKLPGQSKPKQSQGMVWLAQNIAFCPSGQVVYCGFNSLFSENLSRLVGGIAEKIYKLPRDIGLYNAEGYQDTSIMSTTLTDEKNTYILLLNQSFKPKSLKMTLPAKYSTAKELVTGEQLDFSTNSAGSSTDVRIPPRQYRVYVVK